MKTSLIPVLLSFLLPFLLPESAAAPPQKGRPKAKDSDTKENRKGKTKAAPAEGNGAQAKEKEKEEAPKDREAKTASVKPEEIRKFKDQPAEMQAMLRYALDLTGRGLTYQTASADPVAGGTDCSGFVYHILQKHGFSAVPRQSDEMYEWAWKAGTFRACNGTSLETFEFKELRAGDLLFWTNTTKDGKSDRDPPITHVMIYLGERVSDGHRICAGSSDGRTYDGQRMCGVSVFDFKLPAPESSARFIGYAHLPPAKAEK